ncbi:hypothetical protein FHU41_000846 [Psychromicrobium silvestre]|uniref:IPT/TIG domain n=1 Tax=Psychromicrobium silvestre TaxID=1645614 RepID=A0A7Y9S5Q2_9MICC|nr:hypothetical protein [Psychromicrobium silvestre]
MNIIKNRDAAKTGSRVWLGRLIAVLATAALVALPLSPAQAAGPSVSQGLGKFFGGQVLAVNLDQIAALNGSLADNPNGAHPLGPNNQLNVSALGLNVGLGGLLNLLGGANPLLAVGPAAQYSKADNNGDAVAGSGAVSDQGAISVGAPGTPPADAHLDLGPILDTVPALNSVLSTARVDVGALASHAQQLGGAAPTSSYALSDLKIQLTSPAIGGVYSTLRDQVVAPTSQALQTFASAISALNIDLNVVALRVQGNLSASLPDLSAVLPSGFLNGNVDNGVSINLSTGQVILDLTKILTANGMDINNLPPNTPLLSGPIANAIATGITSTLTDLVQSTVQRLTAAVSATRVTGTLAVSSIIGPLGNVTVDASLAEIQDNTTTIVSGSVVGLNLGVLSTLLKPLLRPVVTTLLNTVDNLQTTVVQPLVNGLSGLVSPILDALNQLVPLTANVQPGVGDLGAGSFTVRALQLGILNLASLNFASSTVHGTLVPVLTPVLNATPSTVEQAASTQLTGSGFAPDDTVTLTLPASGAIPATVVNTTTDGSGNLVPVNLGVPAEYPLGAVNITAHPTNSNVSADPTTQITVIKHVYPTTLTADPAALPQGGSSTITGTGYAPGETVTLSGPCLVPPVTVIADQNGGFSTPVTLTANCPVGPTVITGEGDVSQTPATVTVTITGPAFDTALTATPSDVPQGATTMVSGTGFAPGETVTVTLPLKGGVGPVVLNGITVAPDGTFSAALTVPANYPLGAVTLNGIGDQSNTPASTSLNILPAGPPVLSANPGTVQQGGTSQLSGTNFQAGENVVITLPAAAPATAVTVNVSADAAGNFTVPLTVPGNHPVGAAFPVNAQGDQGSTATTTLGVSKGSWDTSIIAIPSTVPQSGNTIVSGSGFAPGESVTVTLPAKNGVGPVQATNVLVAANGSFSTPLTVPSNYPLGAVDITALGPISDTQAVTSLSIVTAGAASLTATPASVPQGGSTQVSGSNFQAGENVVITLAAAAPASAVTVNATADPAGNFTVALAVPQNHPVGTSFPLLATGDQASAASTIIDVTKGSWNTSLSAAPSDVPQGTATTISGTGFAAGETVTVTLPVKDGVGPVTVPNVPVAADGSFSTPLNVPANYPLGTVSVSALGPISDTAATVELQVVTAGPAAISANPVQVPQGSNTLISGTGYSAGEQLTLALPASAPAPAVSLPVTANSAGQFSISLTVPQNHPVATGVTVSANGPEHQASTPIDVILGDWNTSLTLTPSTVPQNTSTSASGGGFAAGETVTVTLPEKDGSGPVNVTTTVNPDGTLVPVSLTIPQDYPLGPVNLTATGTVSQTPATAAASIVANGAPTLTAIPASVPQGGQSQISGTNFAAGENVVVTLAAASPAGAVNLNAIANSAGQFTVALTVPQNHPVGPSFPVTAVGDASSTASTTLAVVKGSWNPALTATPSDVPQGTSTTIDGTGFAAGETVTVTLPASSGVGPVVVPNVLVAADGTFSTPLTVPATYPQGPATVTVLGPISDTPATVQLNVLPAGAPSISASPGTVPQGSSSTISGTNFKAGENVTVTLAAAAPAAVVTVNATADPAGNFSVALGVPMNHPVGASFLVQAVGDQASTASTTLGVSKGDWDTSVSANPTAVPQGTPTTISGTGFAAGETVTVTLPLADGSGPVSVDVLVAPDGTFSTPLTVPADYPLGSATVTVLGPISDTPASVELLIETAGPAAISANPSDVPQGENTTITGINYGPGEVLLLSIPADDPALAVIVPVTANSAGWFTASLPIPLNHPVSNGVVVSGNGPDHQAQTTINVTKTDWNTAISAVPSVVPQGTPTTVSGTGFAAGEKVSLTLPAAGNAPAVTVTDVVVAPDGTFSSPLTVPANYPQGSATISASGPVSDTPASTEINVVPGGPASLTPTPTDVPQGTSLSLSGVNYGAGEVVNVVLPAAAPAPAVTVPVTADSAGQFTLSLTVPKNHPVASGVMISGNGPEHQANASINVTKGEWAPTLSSNPSEVPQGSTTTVSGSGFAAGETVTVTLPVAGGVGPVTVTVLAGDDGTFSIPLTVPADYPQGSANLGALGNISDTPAAAVINVIPGGPASISTEPSVPQGGTAHIVGTNFRGGETVTVTLAAEAPAPAVTVTALADAAGNFTISLVVPKNHPTGASFPIEATGDAQSEASTTLAVTKGDWETGISADPNTVPQDTATAVTGTGFASGESVTVTLPAKDGVGPVTGSGTVNSEGALAAVQLTVPQDYPLGAVTLTALGPVSQTPASTEITVVPNGDPLISSDPSDVPQGTSTKISGRNFKAGDLVTVSIPAAAPAPASVIEATANSAGAFVASLAVPKNHPVQQGVTVTGAGVETVKHAQTKINVTKGDWNPQITADPSTLHQGDTTKVSGTGFAAGEKVTVTLPAKGSYSATTVSDVLVSADGSFDPPLTIPVGYPLGETEISTIGPVSNTEATTKINVTAAVITVVTPQGQLPNTGPAGLAILFLLSAAILVMGAASLLMSARRNHRSN